MSALAEDNSQKHLPSAGKTVKEVKATTGVIRKTTETKHHIFMSPHKCFLCISSIIVPLAPQLKRDRVGTHTNKDNEDDEEYS